MAGRRQPLASPFLLIQGGTRAKVRTLTITGATLTDNGGGEAELVISGGGGGAWTLTGITGTASRIAGFSALGAATYYQIGTDLQAWDPDLDALAALGNGLPYRSGGTWGAYGLGDLAISGASVQVTQARGLRETGGPTTLTMGAVADGKLLGRNGTTIGGVSISTGLTLSAGALAVDTTTIATLASVAAAYQPLDSDLTALAALSTTGLVARTGSATYSPRSIQGGSGVTVSSGDGVSGNPTISFAGGTGQDDDPTSAYTISITPSNATLVSRDAGITVRGASAGNTSARRTTLLSGATGDFFSASFITCRTEWTSAGGDISFKWRMITYTSIAATMRIKMGFTTAGLTSVDAETAARPTAIFRFLTGLGHTNWMCYNQNASGSVETDSGVAVAINTEYLMEIRTNATETKYYINGSLVATHTTYQIPSTSDFGYQAGVYAAGKTIHVVGARITKAWA